MAKHKICLFYLDCTARKRTKATLHLSTHPSKAGLRKDNWASPGEAGTIQTSKSMNKYTQRHKCTASRAVVGDADSPQPRPQPHLGCGCVPFPITTPFLRVATSSLFFIPPSLQQALLGSVLVTPASELFKWGRMVSIILSLAFCANIMFVRLIYADSVAGVGSFPLSYSIPLNSYFIIYIFYWW